jgi:superfamily II DNA or RNA helicase
VSTSSLQPAGLLAKLTTCFFPKPLTAHVRTEVLENGQVELTPVFSIKGHEVPAGLVGPEPYQMILGYGVTLDPTSLRVHKTTQAKPTRLSKNKAAEFLEGLERTGVPVRSRDGKSRPRIARVRPEVALELRPDDSLAVGTELATEDGIILGKPPGLERVKEDDGWVAVGDDLLRVATTGTWLDNILLSTDETTLIGDDVPRLLKGIQGHPKAVGHVEKNEPLQGLSVFGDKQEDRARVDGDAESISISPKLAFFGPTGAEHEHTLGDLESYEGCGGFRRVPEGWIEVTPKSVARHRRACTELARRLGDVSNIRGTDIPRALSDLRQASQAGGGWDTPWAVYFSKAVADSHRIINRPAEVEFRLNIIDSDGMSLLELDPIYNHERFQVSHAEAEDLTKDGEEWVRRRDAWIRLDVEKYERVAAGIRQLGLRRAGTAFTFPARQREQVIGLFSTLGSLRHSQAYADFLMKLADFEQIEEVPLPATLRPEILLRGYQRHGYNWLAFLHRFGLNGILADDMGLGKTLQCLSAIRRAHEMAAENLPSLVICPTSVVNNWRTEAFKFFTESMVIEYTGTNREQKCERIRGFVKQGRSDPSCLLVVTSYDVARRDHETLGRIRWLYVVLDEGHQIKNPSAKRTEAIKTINGRHTLVLTGTPIQNNLEELWSLFDFAMPGFLGTLARFRERYGRNGKTNWDEVLGGKEPLKQRISPFVLRRLKETVASDLPPKTVVERTVELTPRQVGLYKEVIEGAECGRMFAEVAEKGLGHAKLLILAAYTKLRAICNHPALADRANRVGLVKPSDSGKLDCLMDLMEEIVEGQHRTLLFCQSTQMLDIIETLLGKREVRFLRLDGSTPAARRPELVNEFNGEVSIPCFLISTRAGGVGLNLTGADTVIFYDHDWNPANDNQAQDRAHRIGQTKPVTAYKLVSKGTIEEKIIERQAKKQTLADEIIGADEEGFKDLSPEELIALFKPRL